MTTWIITTTPQIAPLVEAARALGGDVTAVVLGDAAVTGVDAVLALPLTGGTPAEALAPAVAALVNLGGDDVVLAANRPAERVIAGAVAATAHAPLFSAVTSVAPGSLTRSRHGGIATETVELSGPAVVVMDSATEAEGAPVAATAADASGAHAARVTAEQPSGVEQVNLGSAKRVVAAGRGFKSEADLQLARDLAAALDAELGCSRPLAEGLDWLPKDSYIGVSGQHIHPNLYVAVGISGQLQHTSGCSGARTVVAINSDANAPIFALADYGVVGDLYQVLPALTAALK